MIRLGIGTQRPSLHSCRRLCQSHDSTRFKSRLSAVKDGLSKTNALSQAARKRVDSAYESRHPGRGSPVTARPGREKASDRLARLSSSQDGSADSRRTSNFRRDGAQIPRSSRPESFRKDLASRREASDRPSRSSSLREGNADSRRASTNRRQSEQPDRPSRPEPLRDDFAPRDSKSFHERSGLEVPKRLRHREHWQLGRNSKQYNPKPTPQFKDSDTESSFSRADRKPMPYSPDRTNYRSPEESDVASNYSRSAERKPMQYSPDRTDFRPSKESYRTDRPAVRGDFAGTPTRARGSADERSTGTKKEARLSGSASDPRDSGTNFKRRSSSSNGELGREQASRPSTERQPARGAEDDGADLVSIPYTTAASEFIYGINPVIAALRAKRRQIYKCYVHRRLAGDEREQIMRLAQGAGVNPTSIRDDFLRIADKITQDRPHNGVILEVSPLPYPPVLSLETADYPLQRVALSLGTQTAEEAQVNSALSTLRIQPPDQSSWRHPMIVLVDGILDPGNLGNIIRTSHFYGVDAVAVCTNTCAPITSPVVVKASSGATEAMPLLCLTRPSDFVVKSKANGWEFFAAVSPEQASEKGAVVGEFEKGNRRKDGPKGLLCTASMTSPLIRRPSVLMLGSEGEGLRPLMRQKANWDVTIAGGSAEAEGGKLNVGVDSLNVGAAAAVLIEAFMRRPQKQEWQRSSEGEKRLDVGERIF